MSIPTPSLRKSALPALLAVPASSPDATDNTGSTPPPSLDNVSVSDTPFKGGTAISVSDADQGLLYKPTEAMVRVKARFWSRWGANPLQAPGPVTLATAQQMTNSAALAGWWSKPGFVSWFCNTSVTEERLDYLLNLALSSAEDILLNTDPKAQSARVQMVKIVAEMSGKLRGSKFDAPKSVEEKRRKAVESMNRAELVEFLQGQGLTVQQVVNIDPTKKD